MSDIVATVVQDGLGPDFQRVNNMLWVDETKDHVRHLLKFQLMNGMTYSACWGVSVDFVPLFRGTTLRSKRSPKSADFDLCLDPIDLSGNVPDWCSFFTNDNAGRVERVAFAVLKAAKADWAELTSLEDVAGSFERRSKMKFRRFSLDNYVQTNLAWGLILIALGDADQGQRRLDAFSERFGIAADNRLLAKAKNEAALIAAAR